MEGFTYVDLFATKGLEYLLVIAMLVVFVPFWMGLKAPARALAKAAKRILPALQKWFHLPEGFFFHQGHTWARPEGGDVVAVGVDDFARRLVGAVSAVKLPPLGASVTQGDRGFTLTVDSTAIPMLSPVDGEVVAVNRALLDAPSILEDDPYGEDSWLVKVRVPGGKAGLENLLSGSVARRWMDRDQDRLLARSGALGTVYADGGLPVRGMARSLDPEKWDEIVKEFFRVS